MILVCLLSRGSSGGAAFGGANAKVNGLQRRTRRGDAEDAEDAAVCSRSWGRCEDVQLNAETAAWETESGCEGKKNNVGRVFGGRVGDGGRRRWARVLFRAKNRVAGPVTPLRRGGRDGTEPDGASSAGKGRCKNSNSALPTPYTPWAGKAGCVATGSSQQRYLGLGAGGSSAPNQVQARALCDVIARRLAGASA